MQSKVMSSNTYSKANSPHHLACLSRSHLYLTQSNITSLHSQVSRRSLVKKLKHSFYVKMSWFVNEFAAISRENHWRQQMLISCFFQTCNILNFKIVFKTFNFIWDVNENRRRFVFSNHTKSGWKLILKHEWLLMSPLCWNEPPNECRQLACERKMGG